MTSFILECSPPSTPDMPVSYPECAAVMALLNAAQVSYHCEVTPRAVPALMPPTSSSQATGLDAIARCVFGVRGEEGVLLSGVVCRILLPVVTAAYVRAHRDAIIAARARHLTAWQRFRHPFRSIRADIVQRTPTTKTAGGGLVDVFRSAMESLEAVHASDPALLSARCPVVATILKALVVDIVQLLPIEYKTTATVAAPGVMALLRGGLKNTGAPPLPRAGFDVAATGSTALETAAAVDVYTPGRTRAVAIGALLFFAYWTSTVVSFDIVDEEEEEGDVDENNKNEKNINDNVVEDVATAADLGQHQEVAHGGDE
eukprot:PhM_4_TR10555/c0_g1_i1/m.17580